jgi:serine/threonine protein phosphatase PrpC
MITCPECGQQAADDAKFCDRCGQGLTAVPSPVVVAITPLEPGASLPHGYRITALMRQSSSENRYRAERAGDRSAFELRERVGPQGPSIAIDESGETQAARAMPAEDPTGPHAKTAELKHGDLPASNGAAAPNGPLENAGSPAADPREAAAVALAAEPRVGEDAREAVVDDALVLTEAVPAEAAAVPDAAVEPEPEAGGDEPPGPGAAFEEGPANASAAAADDVGEVFGRVRALSLTLNHPAFQMAVDGFADNGRVYLVYREELLTPLANRAGGLRMEEGEALTIAIQLCQAVGFLHRRGLRVNDLCPTSIAFAPDGRVRLTGLDYVTNDNELQAEPVFNDGYTAPEIYRARKADKRADIFAIGALLYSCLTGERLEAESWREEAGPVRFYPPHVVTPALEQAVRRALLFDPAGRWPTVEAFQQELLRLAGNLRIRAAGLTDVGMVRELNEDAVMMLEYWRDSQIAAAEGLLYVIADGMGGAEAGEVASALAVGAIREEIERQFGTLARDTLGPTLQGSLETANRRVLDYQVEHPEARGMGSTAVAALIVPPDAALAWVGDSRGYLSQEAGLRQISKDHSLVQRLVEIGQITTEEARHHEHKNVITRSLGARQKGPAGAEAVQLRLKRGDRLLLCSDGLTAHVTDPTIAEILRRSKEPCAAARELVVAANAGGGTDNISVVVIFVS